MRRNYNSNCTITLRGFAMKHLPMLHTLLPYLKIMSKKHTARQIGEKSLNCLFGVTLFTLFDKMASPSFSHQTLAVMCSAIRSVGKKRPFCFSLQFSLSSGYVSVLFLSLKMSGGDASMAFKTWEMSNNIETVNSVDEIFKYDRQQQQEILQAKPWQKE